MKTENHFEIFCGGENQSWTTSYHRFKVQGAKIKYSQACQGLRIKGGIENPIGNLKCGKNCFVGKILKRAKIWAVTFYTHEKKPISIPCPEDRVLKVS